jgi:hypothetical protein
MTTRLAWARLPNTSTARPCPAGLKPMKCPPRKASSERARPWSPVREAASAARLIMWESVA